MSILLVGLATLIGHAAIGFLPPAGMSLIFIVAVLISATGFGFWTGLLAAILAFLAYNFFFVEPVHTFSVTHPEDILALGVFLLVASLTGLLAGRLREEALAARRRAEMLEQIAEFSAALSSITTQDAMDDLIVTYMNQIARGPVALLRQGRHGLAVHAAIPNNLEVDTNSLQAADWVLRHGESMTATAPGWLGNRFAFHPLRKGSGVVAIVGAVIAATDPADDRERERAIIALVQQAQSAIERVTYADEAMNARAAVEQERLRSALLSSVSHDLRTPLATILGSVTSLRELGDAMPADSRADLLLAIEEETGRLSRFVTNLLAMTKLEAGLTIPLDWIDAGDAVRAAADRARRAFPNQNVTLVIAPDLPMIRGDVSLLEQVVFNLIDNAVRHSPPDQAIVIAVTVHVSDIEITVTDRGSGIPPDEQEHVFDKFYSRSAGGVGLGLAICRGVITLMRGTITITSPLPEGQGARLLIRLPVLSGLPSNSPDMPL